MAPIKNEEAIGRTFMLAIRSPIITSALSLLIGGAGGSFYEKKGQNEKLDEILKATKPTEDRITFLEETTSNLIPRVEKLESDTTRYVLKRKS